MDLSFVACTLIFSLPCLLYVLAVLSFVACCSVLVFMPACQCKLKMEVKVSRILLRTFEKS